MLPVYKGEESWYARKAGAGIRCIGTRRDDEEEGNVGSAVAGPDSVAVAVTGRVCVVEEEAVFEMGERVDVPGAEV